MGSVKQHELADLKIGENASFLPTITILPTLPPFLRLDSDGSDDTMRCNPLHSCNIKQNRGVTSDCGIIF